MVIEFEGDIINCHIANKVIKLLLNPWQSKLLQTRLTLTHFKLFITLTKYILPCQNVSWFKEPHQMPEKVCL